jgi:hypothetical protein
MHFRTGNDHVLELDLVEEEAAKIGRERGRTIG